MEDVKIEWYLISKKRDVIDFGEYEPWNEDGDYEAIKIENPEISCRDFDDAVSLDGGYQGFKPSHPLADYVLRCLDSKVKTE